MQSALSGEVSEKGGGPLQGGEEEVRGCVSPSQSNKVSLFRNIRHETEQSEKSQFGDRWYNKQHWNRDRGCEWGGRVSSSQHTDITVENAVFN